MQATLSARSKLIDVLAPRPKSDRAADFGATDSSSRRDGFASKLAEARDRKPASLDDHLSKPGSLASGSRAAGPAKKVDSAQSRDDAGNDTNADNASSTAAARSAKAKKDQPSDADDDLADAGGKSKAEKPAKSAAETTDPTADTLAAANAAAAKPTSTQTDGAAAKPKGDANQPTEVAAAAAVAAQAVSGDADAATGASTDASSSDAVAAVGVKVVDANEKSAKSVVATKNGAAATKANQQNAAVPEATAKPQEGPHDPHAQDQPDEDGASAGANDAELPEASGTEKHRAPAESTFDALLAKLTPQDASQAKQTVDRPAATPAPTIPPEQKFAADNVDNVVKSVRTQLASGGGEMRMRLDPPELGALDVAVKMLDGKMTASFTTNNEQATQLLSHSLNDLKQSLEASGITVDRIQVRQASSDNNAQQQPGEHRRDGQSGAFDQPSGRSDQQRKEAVQKMWRKLAYGSDELDFVA